MACPHFEDLLNERNAGHVAHCEECRALMDALARVDATFDAAFGHISAPPGLAEAVQARIARLRPERRLTPVPEVLDLIGWAAVLVIAAVVVPRFAELVRSILLGLG